MLRQRIMYSVMLITDIIVFIFTNTRPPLIAALVMIILPLISYAVLLLITASLKIECDIGKRTETNTELWAEIKIASRINIYPGMMSFKRTIESVMFGNKDIVYLECEPKNKKKPISVRFLTPMCGMHSFIVEDFKIYDALKLFSFNQRFYFKKNVMVYPQPVEMNVLRKKSSSIENDGVIYDKYRKGNDKTEIFDLRDYEKGDDRRSIHWKLSSKLNKTVVREFSRPNNYKTMILCDLALKFNKNEIGYEAVSNNIAIATSISMDMTKKGIEHSVCLLGENVSQVVEISGMGDEVRLKNGILSVPLSKKEFNTVLFFINMIGNFNVSRLIYVTNNYDRESIKILAKYTDVTIIITSDDDKNTYERNGDIELVSFGSKRLYQSSHNIEV